MLGALVDLVSEQQNPQSSDDSGLAYNHINNENYVVAPTLKGRIENNSPILHMLDPVGVGEVPWDKADDILNGQVDLLGS